jgi:hypothetical protein
MPRLIGNARRYERSEGRRDTRSGHYERRLQTKVVRSSWGSLGYYGFPEQHWWR